MESEAGREPGGVAGGEAAVLAPPPEPAALADAPAAVDTPQGTASLQARVERLEREVAALRAMLAGDHVADSEHEGGGSNGGHAVSELSE